MIHVIQFSLLLTVSIRSIPSPICVETVDSIKHGEIYNDYSLHWDLSCVSTGSLKH